VLRRLRRYLALSGTDQRFLARAIWSLVVIDLELRLWGLPHVVARAERTAGSATTPPAPRGVHRARRYARWLEVASRVPWVRARCLHRSLALHEWLCHQGLPSRLCIGVRKAQGKLQAHAWVELGGEVVNDSPAAVAAFTPLQGLQQQARRRGLGGTLPAPGRAAARRGALEWQ
jgi:hypothetical protein